MAKGKLTKSELAIEREKARRALDFRAGFVAASKYLPHEYARALEGYMAHLRKQQAAQEERIDGEETKH